ncbi:MAG: trypsin-like peptidase domain-containing protein [Lachnospiraceae bacterium]|nr:trypsin-like peptidase domain-containing protein [Lachnospiraceae bacterium]
MTNKKKKHGLSGAARFFIVIGAALVLGFIGAVAYIGIKNEYPDDKGTAMLQNSLVTAEPVITAEKTDSAGEKKTDTPEAAEAVSADAKDCSVTTADVSEVVKNVMPAIVSIDCKTTYNYNSFFGMPQTYEATSSGTGFIIGQNGDELLLATNNHVVSGASSITVTFNNGKSAEASVKGTDDYYDLAVISVDAGKLPVETLSQLRVAVIGDSENMGVGSMSIAIGNALGYGQSITVGYISALNRVVQVEGIGMLLIQTDAAINPGNSGGPLLNAYGEVIGINSVKYADSSVEGMGYAIPMSVAVPIINELMNRVELSSKEIGYIGIDGKNVTSSYSAGFGMPKGVYVTKVERKSPAEQAGIRRGDIITAVNGRSVGSMEELDKVVNYLKVGTEIELKVSRLDDGRYDSVTIKLVLGKRP